MQPHLILPCSHTQTYCNPVYFDVQLLPQYSTYYPHFTSEATPCSERPHRNHVILEFFVPQSYVALNSLLPFLLLPLSAFRLPYQVLVEKQKQTDRQKDRNKEQDRQIDRQIDRQTDRQIDRKINQIDQIDQIDKIEQIDQIVQIDQTDKIDKLYR